MIEMVGALEVLVSPYGALVDFFDEILKKIILLRKTVVFQYDQGVQIDMLVNLAFRLNDYFLERI